MRPLRTLLLLALMLVAVSAAAGPSVASATCTAGAKAANSRVQLWDRGDCTGSSVSVAFGGEADQRTFEKFKNIDSRVYNVNNTRSSIAVAPGTCARLFLNQVWGGDAGIFCATGSRPAAFVLKGQNNASSSMRVCKVAERAGCNRTPPTDPTTGTVDGDNSGDGGDVGDGDPGDVATEDDFPDEGDFPNEEDFPSEDDFPADEDFPSEDDFADEGAGGGSDYGPLGRYDGLRFDRPGRKCTGRATRGARALLTWMREAGVRQRGRSTIYHCSKHVYGGRRDLHAKGRAVDFAIGTRAGAEKLIALLLADDYALARRMGVQEIIYRGTAWSAKTPSKVMRRYRGRSPHRKRLHVGLNTFGAAKKTSFWRQYG